MPPNKEQVREIALQAKEIRNLTWPQIANHLGKSPVYVAMLIYGYGQATEEEASGLVGILDLPEEAKQVLMKVPFRTPAQPWPPNDPFILKT